VPLRGVVLAAVEDARPLLVALRALGLGDLLTAVPALRALAGAFPGHRRVLAAPAELAPLARLASAVHEVVHAEPLAPLDRSLYGADVAVNLHGSGPQSHRALLASAPRRAIAFAHPEVPESAGSPEWRPGEHEVERWCRLLSESGVPADPRRLDVPPPAVPSPPAVRGATLVHPGAASGARRWPPERFASVARAEAAAGRRVAVTGAPEERSLGLAVVRSARLPEGAVLAGRTDLPGLAAAVAAADRLVCGDTGVAHLATALGTPSVVLFGPTSPAEWGPPPDRPWHRALWAGRTGDPHAPSPDPGLLQIGVEEVLAALSEVTPRRGRRSPAPPVPAA
jgi:ADP-heptose:LPS heptosyltransferase